MLSNTQNSVTGKQEKRFEISKTGKADRWVLVQVKKIDIDGLECGTI